MESYNAAPDIEVITSDFPLPGFGFVPINAFVLKGTEPILVDTGAGVQSPEFLTVLRSVIDPAELRWLWLTHADPDHTGSLQALMVENPRLRVMTSFLSVGFLSLSTPLPMDRLHLVKPGETLKVGHRTLHALRPPTFDNPATTGFYDEQSGILFSSDCFGALLSKPSRNAEDLSESDLREGQIFWTTLDSPWIHKAEVGALATELELVRKMEPRMILSSHLPAARGDMAERLLGSVAAARTAQPFVAPSQVDLERMLAAAS
jgi:flavorubredoxin